MLTYALILLGAALMLMILECLLPSGGLLGIMATMALIGAVVLAFRHSQKAGLAFLGSVVVLAPLVIVGGLRLLPHTPIGRRLILKATERGSSQARASSVSDEGYARLAGKAGLAATPLRPAGIIEIGEERYSAVAQGEMIEAGAAVRVIRVEGNSIIVEKASS